MRKIASPVRLGDRGEPVVNLQEGLLLLLRRSVIRIADDQRQFHEEGLKREQSARQYRDLTAKVVSLFQEQFRERFRLTVSGEVDGPTADALNALLREQGALEDEEPRPAPGQFVVRGRVMGSGARPLSGVAIDVFDRDIGEARDRLGEPNRRYVTDEHGGFEVPYTFEQFARGDKDTADLVFEVHTDGAASRVERIRRLAVEGDGSVPEPIDVTGEDLILGIEARLVEEVEIYLEGAGVPRGPSEFELVMQAISPLLLNRSPAQLDEEKFRDVSFISRESGVEQERVEAIAAAFRLAHDADFTDVKPEVFYGLIRGKQIATLQRIATATVDELIEVLTEASSDAANLIPAFDSSETIRRIADLVHRVAVSKAIRQAPAPHRASLAQVLGRVLPSSEQQTTLAREFINHAGTTEEFWQKLPAHPDFREPGKIANIQFALQLGLLAESRSALIDAVQASGKYKSMRDLALNTEDLPALARHVPLDQLDGLPGATQEEKAANYASQLEAVLQTAFPTETVAKSLERVAAPENERPRLKAAAEFLKQASAPESFPLGDAFDIRITHIGRFYEQYKDKLLPGVPEEERHNTLTEVRRTQRLFRVSASPRSFSALREQELGSAYEIARMPRAAFLARFREKLGSVEAAALVHSRATAVSLMNTELAIQAYQERFEAEPMAAGGGIKELPHWAQMFGSVELCDCEHCRSVYGPAAYFVELLQFLDHNPNAQNLTPLDIFIGNEGTQGNVQGRRPDLAYLALSCENTNTTIPYVDLVNEVLESYVVHNRQDKAAAHDVGDRTAAELLANPQYVEEQAYETTLKAAVYPPGLPFDRSLEAVRLYFEQLQTSRLEVMHAFVVDPVDEWTPRLVAETLGLSAREYEILTGRKFDGSDAGIDVKTLYAFETTNPPMSLGEQVRPVREFMARSGLSYIELIEVLKARFVNPAQRELRQIDNIPLSATVGLTVYVELIQLVRKRLVGEIGLTGQEIVTLANSSLATLPPAVVQKLAASRVSVEELKRRIASILGLRDLLGLSGQEFATALTTNFATAPASVQQALVAANHTGQELDQWIATLDGLLVLFAPNSDCDLDETSLQRLDSKVLDEVMLLKLHRFIRLWRKLGWSAGELDAVLVERNRFGQDPVQGLRDIAQIRKVADEIGLSVTQALAFWSKIDTFGPQSTHRRLFENRTLAREPDPAFKLNVTEDEIDRKVRNTPDKLADKTTLIAAALRIREQELATIAADAKLPEAAELTLDNISRLYRYTLLARSLGLPLRLVIELKNLGGGGVDPFKEPASTLEFIKLARLVQNAGLSAPQLAYWCRHDDPGEVLSAPLKNAVEALNVKLNEIAAKAKDERTTLLSSPTADQVRSKLALVIREKEPQETNRTIDRIVTIIEGGDSKLSVAEQKDLLGQETLLGRFMSPQDAEGLAFAFDPNAPPMPEETHIERRKKVLEPLLAYLERELRKQAVAESIAQRDVPIVERLLNSAKVLHRKNDPSKPLLDEFTAVQEPPTLDRQEAYVLLSKAATILNELRLDADELDHFVAHTADFAGFDLNKIPTQSGDGQAVFRFLRALLDYVELREGLGKGPIPFVQCLRAESAADRIARVAVLTGVKGAEVQDTVTQLGLTSQMFALPDGLRAVLSLLALTSRTGAKPVQLKQWSAEPTAAIVSAVRNTLKAKFDDASWLSVARQVSDTLRERQRAALVSYLLTLPNLRKALHITSLGQVHPDRLYEYFLIDVQMDPCMQTSRIKQAISSVQLFIQRCLLNLEPEIRPDAIDAEQWEWRKNYRVWEAARKVFISPENYSESELRDEKSQFFSELESELLQSDMSDAAAQHALAGYLAKMDEVARLETCGLYLEQNSAAPEKTTLHVIARTQAGGARRYYYRRLLNGVTWTPWEKVELDIEGREEGENTGVQLMPYVWKGRLYLYWLTFTKKSDEAEIPTVSAQGFKPDKPPQFWEIKLAWSLYENGTWSQRRLSSSSYEYPPKAGHIFTLVPTPNMLKPLLEAGESILKVPGDHRLGDSSAQVKDFRLKAIEAVDGLEVYVLKHNTKKAGLFTLRQPHSDFSVETILFKQAPIEVTVKGSLRHFMAERANKDTNLTLTIPDGGTIYDTALLQHTKGRYRMVPTAQTTDMTLDKPAFFETSDATYHVTLTPATESIPISFSRADQAHMGDGRIVGSATAAGFTSMLSSATSGRIALESIAHPWPSARDSLAPVLGQQASLRSGNGAASTAFAGLTDHFLGFADSRVWSTRPSVRARFQAAFHPYVGEFVQRLNAGGVPGLLSLDSQTLGNAYLHVPWYPAVAQLPENASGAACIIESTVLRNVPPGRPGNFEAVVLEDSKLVHYWHDSSNVFADWQRALEITDKATGPGCLIERSSVKKPLPNGRGTFEVVVLQADGLAHYTWLNDMPPQWDRNSIITADASGPGCLIESDYPGNGVRSLDVLVPEKTADPDKTRLAHYRRNEATGAWGDPIGVVSDSVLGAACFIQSSFAVQGHGIFEALVLERNPLSLSAHRLVHYWKNETVTEWKRGVVVSDAATGPAWIIQSRVQDSLTHGNFEAVVQEGAQLVHYWRDNSLPAKPWHRGQVISTRATGPGCIMQSHVGVIGGSVGNFEVLVPEGKTLKHYWHANEGGAGSLSERFYFLHSHTPTSNIDDPLPRRDVDFAYGSPYALYNWELFFHLPLLIATRLTRNQRFADAMRWFHYVFNPTDDSDELTTHRFWKVLPLRDEDRTRIDRMLASLHSARPEDAVIAAEVKSQIDDWLANPFMPHRIARRRLNAYKKHVVMKYIDNLIAWGDQLFRRDTIEAINEAEQLYVMAAALLGPRPEQVPRRTKPVNKTYAELRKLGIDEFGNAAVTLENEFPFASALPPVNGATEIAGLLGVADTLYFGIPQNDKLLSYWDTVEDRLFKIRHCMNIEGVVRQLPLFEPPIDPAMLVRAAAQGISIPSVIEGMNAPLPFYRFTYTLQKALELCNDVKALGAALLAAFEKRDAEALAKLRASHETALLTMIKTVKEKQKAEAEAAKEALRASRAVAVNRWWHHQVLLGQTNPVPAEPDAQGGITAAAEYTPSGRFDLVELHSVGVGLSLPSVTFLGGAVGAIVGGALLGPLGAVAGAALGAATAEDKLDATENYDQGTRILSYEREEMVNSFLSTMMTAGASQIEAMVQMFGLLPQIELAGKPVGIGVSASFGSQQLTSIPASEARKLSSLATMYAHHASRAARLASFVLREREWALQNNQAAKEIGAIDRQIVAAQVRIDIADQEIENQQTQIEQATAIEEFLSFKFTKQQLYTWMQDQLLGLYFRAYRLASGLAEKAERCYRFERGVTDSSFVQSAGYWDGVYAGLMAGEKLHLALKQMEQAYHDQNAREYELTKHVSLVSLDPLQLIRLKETGTCEFELPEALFDLDYPGHYMRRIKSVSLTIPCIVGPYVGVNCTLRLLDSVIRYKPIPPTPYLRIDENDNPHRRFFVNRAATSAIATSTAQNDAGMFEVLFRDERYLPFEGAGAISRWRLELGAVEFRQFDYETISDVILHIRYTAREGGERLKNEAVKALKEALPKPEGLPLMQAGKGLKLSRLFSLRHEFPNEWHQLTRAPGTNAIGQVVRTIALPIVQARFPFYLGSATLKPDLVSMLAIPKASKQLANFALQIKTSTDALGSVSLSLHPAPLFGEKALFANSSDEDSTNLTSIPTDPAKTWVVELTLDRNAMQALNENIQDLFLLVTYMATFQRN